jgi:Asp-tRNA(Asn)/Glu-tRNA(Gln) amidotransferase C subunit
MNQYDEIKSLLKKTRMLMEQAEATNLAKSIESEIEADVRQDDEVDVEKVKKDKSKTYRISGGLLTIHGKDKKDLELTTDEKTAFQETMDEFVDVVSDLSDFGVLNLYPNEVQWSGKVIDMDIEFFYSIGENNGVYLNGDMIKLDETLTELVTKLTSFYDKFKSKWAKVISMKKKTQTTTEE